MRCILLLAAIAAPACGSHRTFQLLPRNETAAAATPRPPHTGEVYVTAAELADGDYEPIAKVDVTSVYYGSRNGVCKELADLARSVGADAVIRTRAWFRAVGFSMASPQGTGLAVVLTDAGRAKLPAHTDEDWAGSY